MAHIALTTPILLSQSAFDSTQSQPILFNVISGSQVVKNTLKIINNTTGIEVYKQTQTTYKFEHVIPINTLTNGTYYAMQIQTIDAQNNVSAWSNTVLFYCYSTPTITFTNIPLTSIISNSNFIFEASYNQTQGEILSSYDFILYDVAGNQIATSGVKYVGSIVPPPTSFSYNFSGFENNTAYKIEVKGVTVNDTNITSGEIPFTASYERPVAFGVIQVENKCKDGYMNIISNMLSIANESNPSPPIYIDNKEVSVAEPGQYVAWTDGFEIPDNNTMKIWGRAFSINDTFCIANNTKVANTRMTLDYVPDYTTKKIFVQGKFYNGSINPIIVNSNQLVAPSARDQLFIWVRMIGNTITIKIEITYRSPDRTYTWYDVDNRLYTFQDINNLNITWQQADIGGW